MNVKRFGIESLPKTTFEIRFLRLWWSKILPYLAANRYGDDYIQCSTSSGAFKRCQSDCLSGDETLYRHTVFPRGFVVLYEVPVYVEILTCYICFLAPRG